MAEVFDRSTGASRYDPGELPVYRLVCPAGPCRVESAYRFLPGISTQHLGCAKCGRPFSVYQGEVVALAVQGTGAVAHYVLRCKDAHGVPATFEFTDGSGARWSAAPGATVMLVRAAGGELRAVQDLASGRYLWLAGRTGCFVATAVYGEAAPEVRRLRAFRDRRLVPSVPGRALVAAYYLLSPPVARWLRQSPRGVAVVRRLLDRIVERL